MEKLTLFYISLGAIVVGIILSIIALYIKSKKEITEQQPTCSCGCGKQNMMYSIIMLLGSTLFTVGVACSAMYHIELQNTFVKKAMTYIPNAFKSRRENA